MNLPSTKDFQIEMLEGTSPKGDHYVVRNKHTKVAEHKDNILTRAYEALVKLQSAFDDMLKDIEAEKKAAAARAFKVVT